MPRIPRTLRYNRILKSEFGSMVEKLIPAIFIRLEMFSMKKVAIITESTQMDIIGMK
jgi:hypothetical protein